MGTNQARFHVVQPGGRITDTPVQLVRDRSGRITQLKSPTTQAMFSYQGGNLVTGFQLTPLAGKQP
ncbi:MAG: hypothetical protein GY888_05135 [Planctomycetaceae bacterium]|nr:hypothetical protein [Planctomycetaceae bacterium]